MFYVYILKIKNNAKHQYYIDYTADLKRRLIEHQQHKNVELIYYEAYKSDKLARERERKLKYHGSAWRGLKQRLSIV